MDRYKGNSRLVHGIVISLFFALLFLSFYSPILFSDRLLVSDGLIPAYFRVHWWSNYVFSGFPLVADPIWHTFYPIKFFIYKILHLDFNFYIIFAYFLMAIFTYGYVFTLTRSKLAGMVSGIIYSFSGFAVFEIGHAAVFIHTICWLPLVLMAFEKQREGFQIFWIIMALTGIMGSILGGFPQLTMAMALIYVSYALMIGLQSTSKRQTVIGFMAIIFAGALMTAPVIISTFIQGSFSPRAHLSWEAFSSFYIEIKQLLLFNFPYLMGGYSSFYTKTPIIGAWEIVGNHGFLAFLSFILAGIAAYKSAPSCLAVKRYWVVMTLFTLLVALGPNTGFFNVLLFQIPVINNFRAPERYMFVFSFGISVLAGLGIHSLLSGLINSRREKIWIFAFSIAFATCLILAVAAIYPELRSLTLQKGIRLPQMWSNPTFLIPFIWIIISLTSLYFWLRTPRSLVVASISSLILILEMLSTAYFSYWHPERTFWSKHELNTPPALVTEIKNDLNTSHQRYFKPFHAYGPVGKYFSANLALYYELPSAGGHNPLIMTRYLEFLNINEIAYYLGNPMALATSQALNIAGVKYLLLQSSDKPELWFSDSSRFKFYKKQGEIEVYENAKALPRAWLVSQAIQLSPEMLLRTIHSSSLPDGTAFDPARTALIEDNNNFSLGEDSSASAKITKIGNRQVLINTHSKQPEFLVLADIYFPGWRAYIDGKPTKIFRTDYVFRGINVPAGDHQIAFKFQPLYLYIGFSISAVTLALLLLILFRLYYKQRKP